MSEVKRVWFVALSITGDNGYINTETHVDIREQDARDRLAAFKLRCIKQGDSSVPSYSERVTGKIMKENPQYLDDGSCDAEKYIPTGGVFNGVMDGKCIAVDSFEDAFKSYTVEVEIKRTYSINVTIDEANSQSDAEDKARERIQDGDEDWRLDSMDDEEIDMIDCYED